MGSRNHIQNLLEEKYAGLLSDSAKYGDKIGLNNVLNAPALKKLRTAALLARGPVVAGADDFAGAFGAPDLAAQALQTTAGVSLGVGLPMSGKKIADMQNQAYLRQKMQQAGKGTGFGDVMASTGNIGRNMTSLARTAYMGSTLAGIKAGGLSAFMSPGMMASSMTGGIGGLGSAVTGGAMTGGAAMLPGVAAMIAATKGGKALYDLTQKDSSTTPQLGRKYLMTRGTSPHQLEQEYGNVTTLRMQIVRMQNLGQLKPGEALMANILAMIEGHTSVLPFIAAEAVDAESRRNKEGANKAQNVLNDLFGPDGLIQAATTNTKRRSIMEKIFNGMERGTANLNSTFDIFGQISNTLAGKSSVALYNEANDRSKADDPLKAEKQFASRFGLSTGLVQAIHTSPAQIMDKADNYEGKVLSILGLMSEISRFSAHELLKIRTDGFGLKSGTSSHGLLQQLKDINEEEALANLSWYEQYGMKGIDEFLGYIPGYNVLSGSVKMLNSAFDLAGDFAGDIEGGKVRSPFQVFKDWMSGDVKNELLMDETQLRSAVGATEMGAQDLMANYMGIAFPDRFELLLKYNLSQMESLESMAGNIDRSVLETLSMNKYTGNFGTQGQHDETNRQIRERLKEEMTTLGENSTLFGEWFNGSRKESIIAEQIQEAIDGGNGFLSDFVGSDGRSISSADSRGRASKRQLSAQDQQDKQKEEERIQAAEGREEYQIDVLEEIRDSLGGGFKTGRKNRKGAKSGKSGGFDVMDMVGGAAGAVMMSGAGGIGKFLLKAMRFVASPKKLMKTIASKGAGYLVGMISKILPFAGPIGLAVGAAITAYQVGSAIYDWWKSGDDEKEKLKQIEAKEATKRIETTRKSEEDARRQKEEALKKASMTQDNILQISNSFNKHTDAQLQAYLDDPRTSPMVKAAVEMQIDKRNGTTTVAAPIVSAAAWQPMTTATQYTGPSTSGSGGYQSVKDMIAGIETKHGANSAKAYGQGKNKNGYEGKYQFRYRNKKDAGWDIATALGYDPKGEKTPEMQEAIMDEYLRRNAKQLKRMGIEPTAYNLWLAHNQGAGGARAMHRGKLTDTIRRNIRNQGVKGTTDEELIANYHRKFKPKFDDAGQASATTYMAKLEKTMDMQEAKRAAKNLTGNDLFKGLTKDGDFTKSEADQLKNILAYQMKDSSNEQKKLLQAQIQLLAQIVNGVKEGKSTILTLTGNGENTASDLTKLLTPNMVKQV